MKNFFVKTHGLGNDYLVMNSHDISFEMNVENIKTICDVHYGIGSDGILLLVDSDRASAIVRPRAQVPGGGSRDAESADAGKYDAGCAGDFLGLICQLRGASGSSESG